ncbi:non-ribosomal peptide synthetase [Actinokineospora globicatena]|uniref:Carrier domain-containing protein n=1 Tax=Actinokineospora globicatena TaxID=103729 RepID=A0A9W6V5K3_9PSEU|nr:non-ribosomal peptide synthetase [Actinokineospora globicatena]GLW90455.1 hypothetical protein Aglo03_12710 [Actinokineospora globicatena]
MTTLVTEFAAQVERDPDAPAVRHDGVDLSYRELDGRADQLAGHLAVLGVGPERVVAVCLPRSPALLVAWLGVLKAGGVFLPLDPDYPPARIEFMLSFARAPFLITDQALDVAEGTVVVAPDARGSTRTPVTALPENLAYCVFTSGSTGVPKGVQLTHAGAVNLLAGQRAIIRSGPGDRILQFSPLSFDAFVWEVSMALLTGACLVLPTAEQRHGELVEFLAAAGITVATLSPSTVVGIPLEDTGLRTLVSAGEPCGIDLAERFADRFEFLNAYGPAEATVCATVARVRGDQVPTIGTAVHGVTIHVLDAGLNLVPQGTAGEIYLGGAGLARGYLHRPALTAERFLPNPFADGQRLYRTGDRGRVTGTGEVEFLGRVDHQVKIRGQQVDPLEPENALREHPLVRAASVSAVRDADGGYRLVGHVVGDVDEAGLRAHLRTRFPEYLVPTAILVLDTFPLTPNGKLDRTALPMPRWATPTAAPVAEHGTTGDVRRTLTEILVDVLGVPDIGPHDHFFDDLGGDSLRLVRVRQQISRRLGRKLDMAALFGNPTLATLTAHLTADAGQAPSGGAERADKRLARRRNR